MLSTRISDALRHYVPILTSMLIVLFLYIISDIYFSHRDVVKDRIEYRKYLDGQIFYDGIRNGFPPVEYGLPPTIDIVLNKAHHMADGNNIILIGQSTTWSGVNPDKTVVPANWKIFNFGAPGGSIYSYRILTNFINNIDNNKPGKTDLIIIHIAYFLFIEQPLDMDYLKERVEYAGYYTVDDSLQVTGSMSDIQRFWQIINAKIRLGIPVVGDKNLGPNVYTAFFLKQKIMEMLHPRQNADNSLNEERKKRYDGSNPELLEKYRQYWSEYTKSSMFPGRSTSEFMKHLHELRARTNVAVVNLYVPTWHQSYPKYKMYDKWVNEELIPLLKKENIKWVDFTSSIPDDEYADSSHLLRKGRERYTRLFNRALEDFTRELNVQSSK